MEKLMFLCVVVFVFVDLQRALSSDPLRLWGISKEDSKYKYEHKLKGLEQNRPLIIAHRGSSGTIPEHTKEAYQNAVAKGADVLECDAALSKDGKVVCLHESWMNATSNVALVFRTDKINNYNVDGKNIEDYFSVDFTLEELKSLGKVQQRAFRDQSFNGKFKIATLKEMMEIAMKSDRAVGVHVELKDPDFYNQHTTKNVTFEQLVVKEMLDNGCQDQADFRCFIQSFNKESLKAAKNLTKLPLVYLTEEVDSLKDEELDQLATWVYGVGPWKEQIISKDNQTDLIERCHKRGLKVHAYTFRNENMYLLPSYAQDAYNEMAIFYKLNLDGYFTDFPHTATNFLNAVHAFNHSPALNAGFLWLFVALGLLLMQRLL